MVEDWIRQGDVPNAARWITASNLSDRPFGGTLRAYENSRRTAPNGVVYMAVRDNDGDRLLILENLDNDSLTPGNFTGTVLKEGALRLLIAPQNAENALVLRELFPHTSPSMIGSSVSSFGLGDRLGLASPGHILLFQEREAVPILAQQSLRELDLMGRSYSDVIDAATWAVFNTGFEKPWAADGDHLKTVEAVKAAVQQGCTMITADLSDHLAFEFMDAPVEQVAMAYAALDAHWRQSLKERYPNHYRLADGTLLKFDSETRQRIALTYGQALNHAVELQGAGHSAGRALDFEISIDETDLPTSPEAHFFVAKELMERNVRFTSLAPRFVGEFQKGIDYIGDVHDFAASFAVHAAIADELGYKISIHSSSDKFSVYPIIRRLAKGPCHLKTSGTNWLVALETIAKIEPTFFRELFHRAYQVFPVARTYYHITPDMAQSSDVSSLSDEDLPHVFSNATDRQVLHVSYGELFKDSHLKSKFFAVLRGSIEDYWFALEAHIRRHLELLEG